MQNIRLVVDAAFATNCVLSVYDGGNISGKRRCKITVEYAPSDIRQLKAQGKALTREEALEYYKDWIYNTVRHYIADEWKCVGGLEEIMGIVGGHISQNY